MYLFFFWIIPRVVNHMRKENFNKIKSMKNLISLYLINKVKVQCHILHTAHDNNDNNDDK